MYVAATEQFCCCDRKSLQSSTSCSKRVTGNQSALLDVYEAREEGLPEALAGSIFLLQHSVPFYFYSIVPLLLCQQQRHRVVRPRITPNTHVHVRRQRWSMPKISDLIISPDSCRPHRESSNTRPRSPSHGILRTTTINLYPPC